jgi:hypothetical protein
VKLDKLLKKLKRDLAASPQKAAALGLMILVALYFWAPLIMKFGGKAKTKKVAASQVILTDDPIVTKVAARSTIDSTQWDRVRQTLAQDQFMQAALLNPEWSNPFRRVSAASVESDLDPAQETASQRPLPETPMVDDNQAQEKFAGIVVSGVLIGPRERAAFIRGTTYRVGDVLVIGGENGEPKLELLLTRIDEDGVDVNCEGRTLRLERPKKQLAPGSHVKTH